jgi:hypothetical protein
MGADGLNYLTLGAAWLDLDLDLAVNGIWSPLYGVVAAAALRVVDPPVHLVFPTVQVVNFAIFALGLVCFERLWGELRALYLRDPGEGRAVLPEGLWWAIGYALFAWAGLNLVEVWAVTPDMLVAALVYASAAQIVRIARGGARAGTYLALGVLLGLGYLAKAPMLPLSVVALLLTGVLHERPSTAVRAMLPAAVGLLVVAGPFLIALSVKEGRPTFSQVSRFTYLKHVNRIPYPHWREGVIDGIGTPLHPPRQVHADPDVFVFAGPVGGSYPPSFDPDYWTEGLTPRVDPFQQMNEIANSAAFYFALFFRAQGAFLGVFALALALAFAGGARPALRDGAWPLTAWALACFAMYALVFVTERYVAPFVVLFWAGLIGYWRFPSTPPARFASTFGGILLVGVTLANVLALDLEGAAALVGLKPPVESVRVGQFRDGASASPPDVAAALTEMGVEPGTDVAHVGYSFTALWAYLARVRIVAEIWPEQAPSFWSAAPAERERVLRLFREAGARHVIAEIPPDDPEAAAGWTPVGGTGYLMKALD